MYDRLMRLVAAIESASALDASDDEHNTIVCGLNEANNSTHHMRTNQGFTGETGDQIDAWTDRAMKQVQAINEGGADWVYVDAADNKLGQFSGSNNGVRRSITEFEPDVALTHDEQVFLSWVTRTMLESRLAVTTMIATMSLLLMIPVALFALIT